jgi:hypothetical protein
MGMPIIEYRIVKDEKEVWVTKELLEASVKKGYNLTPQQRTSYAKPAWLVNSESETPKILILDDFSRAIPMVLQACMRIVDEQGFMSWSLPKGSTVILTTNPSDGEFQVSEMDSAMESRYLKIKMKASVEDWARDYAENNIDERFTNFMLKTPEVIEGTSNDKGDVLQKANLRTWTKFFHSISGIKDLSSNWTTVFNIGQNSIPVEDLILLNQFIKNGLDKLISVDNMLNDNIEKTLKQLEKVIGVGDKKRQDLSALISKRLLNHALNNHKSFSKDQINNYAMILESDLLKPDLVYLSLKKLNTLLPSLISDHPKLVDKMIM